MKCVLLSLGAFNLKARQHIYLAQTAVFPADTKACSIAKIPPLTTAAHRRQHAVRKQQRAILCVAKAAFEAGEHHGTTVPSCPFIDSAMYQACNMNGNTAKFPQGPVGYGGQLVYPVGYSVPPGNLGKWGQGPPPLKQQGPSVAQLLAAFESVSAAWGADHPNTAAAKQHLEEARRAKADSLPLRLQLRNTESKQKQIARAVATAEASLAKAKQAKNEVEEKEKAEEQKLKEVKERADDADKKVREFQAKQLPLSTFS